MTDEIARLRAENRELLRDIMIRDHMIMFLQDELMKHDLGDVELLTDEQKRQWYDSLSADRIKHLEDSLRQPETLATARKVGSDSDVDPILALRSIKGERRQP